MTRDPRPTAPPVPGKGGTRGLDTTDTSPGARHPTTLDDYPVPTKPDRHLTRYGSPVGRPVVGTGLRQGGVPLSATHRQAPRLQGPSVTHVSVASSESSDGLGSRRPSPAGDVSG